MASTTTTTAKPTTTSKTTQAAQSNFLFPVSGTAVSTLDYVPGRVVKKFRGLVQGVSVAVGKDR